MHLVGWDPILFLARATGLFRRDNSRLPHAREINRMIISFLGVNRLVAGTIANSQDDYLEQLAPPEGG